MAADLRRRERDSAELFSHLLSCTYNAFHDPPVSAAARLSALLPNDAVDRVSRLPDALLHNIVSRLPVKDAARTSALSHRWRGVWRSAPLVLADNDLLPAAVSHIIAAHLGSFRCIHLTTSRMEEFQGPLTRWLQLLAAKGTQELVLGNRLSPLGRQLPAASFSTPKLPAAIFSISTLTRLYLALWKFPNTDGLPLTASFPNLRELGLCTVVIESRHLDFILARSPVLEVLYLQGNLLVNRLTLISHSLRCVHVIGGSDLEIAVQEAPRLERLIIWAEARTSKGGSRKTIEIGNAPALCLLGYLEPEFHSLQVSANTIKKGTKASPQVSTVKILALKVRFGILKEAKFLPSFLRSFPNVEMLNIESKRTVESTSKLTLKLWEKSGAIDCIRSKLKLVSFKNFRGDDCELCFLKFLLESARMLTKLWIVYDNEIFTSVAEVRSAVEPLFRSIWASNCCSLLLIDSASPKMP